MVETPVLEDERERWKDAKLVSKVAAQILMTDRSLTWAQALRQARRDLGYVENSPS